MGWSGQCMIGVFIVVYCGGFSFFGGVLVVVFGVRMGGFLC